MKRCACLLGLTPGRMAELKAATQAKTDKLKSHCFAVLSQANVQKFLLQYCLVFLSCDVCDAHCGFIFNRFLI